MPLWMGVYSSEKIFVYIISVLAWFSGMDNNICRYTEYICMIYMYDIYIYELLNELVIALN